ncbi:MAG: fluoride efflux transporter CrcB [Bacteroidota bacterium]|jgi:CrcB protein
MLKQILLVGLGGGCGSVFRYLTSLCVTNYYVGKFPLSTFVANILGCILIGFLIGASDRYAVLNSDMRLLLITGFCGGYTTFSTFSSENLALFSNGFYFTLVIYIVLSIILGLLAVYLGTLVSKI